MKKSIKGLFTLVILSIILAGCTWGNDEVEALNEFEKTKKVTLYIEDTLYYYGKMYVFNGFTGDDTLSFSRVHNGNSAYSILYYQPAKIGHNFRFKEFYNMDAEILDFSREKGYVKLKLQNSKNQKE